MDIGRALSRKKIEEIGFDYKSYAYPTNEGDYLVTLDMKEWGKSPCLHCYFTAANGDKLYTIAFFDKSYRPTKSSIDFSSEDVKIGNTFLITMRKSKKGNLYWENAQYAGTSR